MRQPAHYRIFALQKCSAVLQRYDTASVPCLEGRPRATCNEREARSSPRRIYVRLLSQSARKRRALCPYKELQSAFIPFIASERMRYESLRADKRKTARPFFASRLIYRFRAVFVRGTSVYRELPHFALQNAQLFCKGTTRHPCRVSRGFFIFGSCAAIGALRGVPAGRGSGRPYERSKRRRLRSEKVGSEGETSPFEKTEPE